MRKKITAKKAFLSVGVANYKVRKPKFVTVVAVGGSIIRLTPKEARRMASQLVMAATMVSG